MAVCRARIVELPVLSRGLVEGGAEHAGFSDGRSPAASVLYHPADRRAWTKGGKTW